MNTCFILFNGQLLGIFSLISALILYICEPYTTYIVIAIFSIVIFAISYLLRYFRFCPSNPKQLVRLYNHAMLPNFNDPNYEKPEIFRNFHFPSNNILKNIPKDDRKKISKLLLLAIDAYNNGYYDASKEIIQEAQQLQDSIIKHITNEGKKCYLKKLKQFKAGEYNEDL